MQIPFDVAIPFFRIYPKKKNMGLSYDFGSKTLNATVFRMAENLKNLNVQYGL